MTPTQRTLQHLNKQGFTCAIVEKYNSFIKIRQDLFGIIDILCLTPTGVLGVQSTGKDFYGHETKIMGDKRHEAMTWLITPGTRLVLYSWTPLKVGKRKRYGEPKIREFFMDDFKDRDWKFT